MRDFGIYRRLRDIREDKDLYQVDIAEYLNVDKSTYSKWDNEVEVMPLKRVGQFVNIMKKSLDYITGLSDDSSDIDYEIVIDKKAIGERIRSVRLKYKHTQEDLADLLGSCQSCISDYEAGNKLILSSYAYQICRLYDISFDWLICGYKKS